MARASADPYEGMADTAVLARAAESFRKAAGLPVGSVQRAIQWAAFDSAMMELNRRAVRHVLVALGEADSQ
jgi:hypothetical protein